MILAIILRPFTIGFLSVVLPALTALVMFAGTALGAPASDAAPVTIRPHVVIDGGAIHLEDVFEGAGIEPSRVIARAPRPGQRTTLEARWLWRIARLHGLDWRPLSRQDAVTVERSSTVVTSEQIKTRLRQALESRIADDSGVELVLDRTELIVLL